jgi:uncharacterized protein YciI
MKKLFAVIRRHGSGWQPGLPLERQTAWDAHAAFMDGLESEGCVVLAGPLEGASEALLIIRAETPEEVMDRLSTDPWTGLGMLCTSRVMPWTLRIGSLP